MSDPSFSWLTSDQIYTRKRRGGIGSSEILALPDDLRQIVSLVMREEPVTLEQIAAALRRPADDVRGQVALLTAQGWLEAKEQDGETVYGVHLARKRTRQLPPGFWQVLEGKWNINLLRWLDPELSHAFEMQHLDAGDCLFQAGDWGQTMYLLESGCVEQVADDADGRPVVLARYQAGDIIGEIAVLHGERHQATARVVEPATVWSLHKADLDRMLARAPSAGLAIRREIARSAGLHRSPNVAEKNTPVLVIGDGVVELADALVRDANERVLVLNTRPGPLPQPDDERVRVQSCVDLDSKGLEAVLRRDTGAFDRILVAAPAEMHAPLMGIIGRVALVIDLSGQDTPWVVAAARRRWTISPDHPQQIAFAARRLCHRVVGLALGGGAARTAAHIGVLQALEEAQIPVDLLASTGMGAVIAGLYAAGFSPAELSELFVRNSQDLNPFEESFSLRLKTRSALFAAKRARSTVRRLLGDRTFADLRIPLWVVAADLSSGEPVTLSKGSVADALEASLALGGLVMPSERDACLLVDGGLVNPLPGDVLAAQGADIIIGVSVSTGGTNTPKSADTTGIWLQLRQQVARAALASSLRHLDALITPDVSSFDDSDFDRAGALIVAGAAAARQESPFIHALLQAN